MRTITFVSGSDDAKVHHTDNFGKVPNSLIETAKLEDFHALSQEIFREVKATYTPEEEASLAAKISELRLGVGALWLQLRKQLEADTDLAYRTSESFWGCFLTALFSRRLHPQKYYRACGKSGRGFGALVVGLSNVPLRELMAVQWGYGSWQEHVHNVWPTMKDLVEKEQEYRDAANVILQVGIGWGGMLLGVVGLCSASSYRCCCSNSCHAPARLTRGELVAPESICGAVSFPPHGNAAAFPIELY
jgi:hypothetical protein